MTETDTKRARGGRPAGIEIKNREQLRYDLARIGDRTTLTRRLRQAIQEDERRPIRRYPFLPQAATIWEWLDRGRRVGWPGHALRDLSQFIRDHTGRSCDWDAWIHPSATRLHVCNAPRKPSLAFRGRDAELEELKSLLTGGENASVSASIEGLPGIGKTELALNVAYSLAADAAVGKASFPQGIFWFNAENRDLTAAWDEIAVRCLDVTGDTVQARVAEAIRRIERSPEPSLLILDNAFLGKDERWEEEQGKPAPLPEGPHIRLLVTTRNDYFGSTAFRQKRLGVLSESASRQLLLEISRRDPARDAQRLDGLDELLEELSGHPLALEISGVYLQKNGSETPRSFLRLIARGERFERHARQTGYAVQKSDYESTLHGAFTALWASLDAETRGWWQRASYFEPAPVSADLSEAVGLSRQALEALRDVQLIDWDASGKRWIMHRLIRAFGQSIGDPQERAAARHAMVLGCAARAGALHPQAVLSAYLADRLHFDAALALAHDVLSPEQELQLLLTVGPALVAHRGYTPDEAQSLYERALQAAARSGRHEQLFFALDGLWSGCWLQGAWKRAGELVERLAELARQHGSSVYQLSAQVAAGQTYFYTGRFEEAWRAFEKGMPLLRSIPVAGLRTPFDPEVMLLSHAALARCLSGWPEQGLRLAQEAVELAEERRYPPTLAMACGMRAGLHLYRGDLDDAEHYAMRAMQIGAAEELEIFRHWGSILMLAARVTREPGCDPAVLDAMQGHLQAASELNPGGKGALIVAWVAHACAQLGRRSEGLALADRALALVDQSGESFLESELWRTRAALCEEESEVRQCLARAVETAARQGARWFELRALADLLEAPGASEGERRASKRRLAQLQAEFSEGFELTDLRRARALLGGAR